MGHKAWHKQRAKYEVEYSIVCAWLGGGCPCALTAGTPGPWAQSVRAIRKWCFCFGNKREFSRPN